MKLIKNITKDDHILIFNVVNLPPAGQAITQTLALKRKNLYKEVIAGIPQIEPGVFDFGILPGAQDWKLSEENWRELKSVLENASFENMFSYTQSQDILQKLEEAQTVDTTD